MKLKFISRDNATPPARPTQLVLGICLPAIAVRRPYYDHAALNWINRSTQPSIRYVVECITTPRSSAIAEGPRDALCQSIFIHSFIYSPNAIKTKHKKITQLGMTTRQRICTYRSHQNNNKATVYTVYSNNCIRVLTS